MPVRLVVSEILLFKKEPAKSTRPAIKFYIIFDDFKNNLINFRCHGVIEVYDSYQNNTDSNPGSGIDVVCCPLNAQLK